jgi:hypothetical protein
MPPRTQLTRRAPGEDAGRHVEILPRLQNERLGNVLIRAPSFFHDLVDNFSGWTVFKNENTLKTMAE